MKARRVVSPVSIQTQSLALRALRKRKPQETQAIAFEWKPGCSRVEVVVLEDGKPSTPL